MPHRPQPLSRKSQVRKKTNDAKAVAHAEKVAVRGAQRAVAKVAVEADVVAEAVTVQNAAKAVANVQSAARLEQVSAKTATVNARRTAQSEEANAKNVTASAQNAVKAVVHAKSATEATANQLTVKTVVL